jgi:type IV pilus assembly protein PilO
MSPALTLKKTPVAIKLAVVLAGLIALAAAGYFLLVGPKKSQAKTLSQEITQLDQQIQEARAQATQAAGLSKILVADYYKLQTAMPNDPKVAELFFQLSSVAKATGIRFDSIQPGTVVDASTYQVIPVTLIFQGSFYDLSDFLYRLQSLVLVENHKLSAKGRLFTIDEISFAEGESGFPKIAATLQVDAYVFGHPSSASTPTPSTTTTSTSTTPTTTTSTSTTPTTTTSSSSEGTTTSATGGG